ncbi:hypothetical protein HPP92_000912 [Vanilla planifolia]|uniref:Uncharacterized protein n=1 Tax=Vanilla planifolia TaxID=51239 RepID=A0A835RYC9_VANPL|nr:hypothetical protein HPP92_000912 [Vanilla planifolia]
MVKERRVDYRRFAGRKRKGYSDDDDGSDEDYIAETEGDSYESDVSEDEWFSEASSKAGTSEDAEDTSSSKIGFRRGRFSCRGRSSDSDDEDFLPDAEEGEEESLLSGNSRGRARLRGRKCGGRKESSNYVEPKSTRRLRKVAAPAEKRRRMGAGVSDEEEGWVKKERVAVNMHKKGSKKVSKRTVMSNDRRVVVNKQRKRTQVRKKVIFCKRRKEKSTVDPATSDSDFVISDEDCIIGDGYTVPGRWKISRTSRHRLPAKSQTREYDDDIYVTNERDLNAERVRNVRKPGSVCIVKEKLKVKEKDANDLGKQVCGICLSEEQKGTVRGILNCCSHFFCLACIVEWSKVESRCPLCKRRFLTITKSSKCNPVYPMRATVIRVEKRNQVYQPTEEELRVLLDPYESVVCMECHVGGDDNLMLLCDICDSSAHTYCVGLGRDVPDGNWYCDCCRFAGEDSLQSQVHESRTEDSSNVSNVIAEDTDYKNLQINAIFQQPESSHGNAEDASSRNLLWPPESLQEQSSSHGSDRNLPPINLLSEDNCGVSTPSTSGAFGTSTLSVRRAIRQRIHSMLSNRITRQTNDPSMHENNSRNQAFTSLEVSTSNASHSLKKTNPIYQFPEYHLPKSRNMPHASYNSAPCTINEANKFQHVEGAKDQVQSIVKHHLKKLTQEKPLERSTFKKVARNATHTILAACGIEHRRNKVTSLPLHPPNNCIHVLDGGPANLVLSCCSSCFFGYVKNVVKALV